MENIWKNNNTLRESDFDWEAYDRERFEDEARDAMMDANRMTAADFDSYCHFVFVLESEEVINAIKEILNDVEDETDEVKVAEYSKKFLDVMLKGLENKEIKEASCSFLDSSFSYRDWKNLEKKLKAEKKCFIEMDVNVDGADIATTPYYPETYDSPAEGGDPYETSLGEDGTPTLAEALKWSEEEWNIDADLFDVYFA